MTRSCQPDLQSIRSRLGTDNKMQNIRVFTIYFALGFYTLLYTGYINLQFSFLFTVSSVCVETSQAQLSSSVTSPCLTSSRKGLSDLEVPFLSLTVIGTLLTPLCPEKFLSKVSEFSTFTGMSSSSGSVEDCIKNDFPIKHLKCTSLDFHFNPLINIICAIGDDIYVIKLLCLLVFVKLQDSP